MKKIPVRQIHTTYSKPDLSESFSIREIGALLAGKDMVQELHRHDYFYILAVKKGTGKHDIDFNSYTIYDHTIFFMRPRQVHQLLLKAGSTGYLIQFGDEFYHTHDTVTSQRLRKVSHRNYYKPDAGRFQKLYAALTSIFREYQHKQEGYREVIQANLDIFFIELVRQHNSDPAHNAGLYQQEQFESFAALAEANIFDHKQVAYYAAALNLSAYQLNAITKTVTGKTCSEHLNEHIILEAKRYLLGTSYQVKEIADHLGYEDVSYFIRLFKKHTGCSPNEFRNNFR